MTKTKATGGIKTDARTSGNFEHGQDDFQTKDTGGIYTDTRTDGNFEFENTTKTKATGRIETDTRTSGDYEHGQNNFQQSENKARTRIDQEGIETDLVRKYQDGICDFQRG